MPKFLILLLLLALPARAEAPLPSLPVLDVAAVPGLGPAGRAELARTLLRNLPRAFAIGPGGAFASRAGNAPPEVVDQAALRACQAHTPGGAPCTLWLRGLEIVAPARAWAPSAPPADTAFGDARRIMLPDPRFLWWGPETARGVLVWAHGRNANGADSRGSQPQAWVRHFNNAGWDIWRFDRDPATDYTRAATAWLRQDLAELRRRGYRRIVAAGQSRGAWNALALLDTPGAMDATIAIAPAAIGSLDEAGYTAQVTALHALVAGATGGATTRVAIATFAEDPFAGLPEQRAEALRGLAPRVGAFLFLDRPAGITGHGGGNSRAFAERYGACLFLFATAATPPRDC